MKNFILQVIASSVGAVVAGVVCVLLFVAVLIAAASGASDDAHRVPSRGVLVVDLSQTFTDRGPMASPSSLTSAVLAGGRPAMALRSAVGAIRHAAGDARIAALLVRGGESDTGWASLRELAESLDAFRASGKPVIAWAANWDERSWYVACRARPVATAPDGTFECDGLAANVMYYGAALKKLGVEMQVTRVGKYKSAVEPFLLESMSDANREQILGYLGALDATFRDEAETARGLAKGTIARIVEEQGFLPAKAAVEAGLADSVMAWDEVLAEVEKTVARAGDSIPHVALAEYAQSVAAGASTTGTGRRVAVVFAEGEIVDGEEDGECGGDTVARRLRDMRLDAGVAAIVLRVNSPGGSAQASEAMLREVKLAKASKPVVVSMGDVAASGGYWIASLADEIVAHPNTITGSIGVFGMYPNVRQLADSVGVRIETVKTGPFADAQSVYRPRTAEEIARIQTHVDRIYEDFLDRVTTGRSLAREKVEEIAQGRVWAGAQAKEHGLVDAFGGLDEAIRRAAARAKLSAGHGVRYHEPEPTFFQQVASQIGSEKDERRLARAVAEIPGAEGIGRALAAARSMRRGGVFARLPWELAIR